MLAPFPPSNDVELQCAAEPEPWSRSRYVSTGCVAPRVWVIAALSRRDDDLSRRAIAPELSANSAAFPLLG
jgi:hypothetical protein